MYDPSFWLWYYHETNRVCADEQETRKRITVRGLAKIKKLWADNLVKDAGMSKLLLASWFLFYTMPFLCLCLSSSLPCVCSSSASSFLFEITGAVSLSKLNIRFGIANIVSRRSWVPCHVWHSIDPFASHSFPFDEIHMDVLLRKQHCHSQEKQKDDDDDADLLKKHQ